MTVRYRRLPGASRRYENVETGAVISDRQYRKIADRASALGPITPQRLKKQRVKSAVYNEQVSRRAAMLQKQGVTVIGKDGKQRLINKTDVRTSADIKALRLQLADINKNRPRYTRGRKKGRHKPRTPEENRKLIAVLKALGLREDIPDKIRPGESGRYVKLIEGQED